MYLNSNVDLLLRLFQLSCMILFLLPFSLRCSSLPYLFQILKTYILYTILYDVELRLCLTPNNKNKSQYFEQLKNHCYDLSKKLTYQELHSNILALAITFQHQKILGLFNNYQIYILYSQLYRVLENFGIHTIHYVVHNTSKEFKVHTLKELHILQPLML